MPAHENGQSSFTPLLVEVVQLGINPCLGFLIARVSVNVIPNLNFITLFCASCRGCVLRKAQGQLNIKEGLYGQRDCTVGRVPLSYM